MAWMKWRGTKKRGRYYASFYEKDKVTGKLKKRWKRLVRDREAARKMLHDLEVNQDRKIAGLPELRVWKEFLPEYMKLLKTKREPGTVQRQDIILRHLVRLFPIVDLTDLTPKLLDDYMAARKDEGIDPATINKELGSIRKAIKQAKIWGYEVHDVSLVEKMTEIDKEQHAFTKPEIRIMFEKADPLFLMIIRLGLYMGLRLGDFLGLRWDDIIWDEGKVRLGKGWRAKRGKKSMMPLSPKLAEHLRAWQRVCGSSENVIPWDRSRHQLSGMFTHFLRKRCGIPAGSLHSLKHTFITALKRKDVSRDKVQKLARHDDPRTQDIYEHMNVEDVREGVERLDFEVEELKNGVKVEATGVVVAYENGAVKVAGSDQVDSTA